MLSEQSGVQGRGNGLQAVADPWRLQITVFGSFHLKNGVVGTITPH